ncbi:MAG: hypothetical protein CSA97_03765, partial [Bacteroidetes bacterium]
MKKEKTAHEQLVQVVLKEGKSLKKVERKKAGDEYDPDYVKEKIGKYRKGIYLSRLMHFVLYATAGAGVVGVVYYENIPDGYVLLVKIFMCLLLLVCILGTPAILTNHGRNASVLRILRHVQDEHQKEVNAQNAAVVAALELQEVEADASADVASKAPG